LDIPKVRLVPRQRHGTRHAVGAGLAAFCDKSGLRPSIGQHFSDGTDLQSLRLNDSSSLCVPLSGTSHCACSLQTAGNRGGGLDELDRCMQQVAMGCGQCHYMQAYALHGLAVKSDSGALQEAGRASLELVANMGRSLQRMATGAMISGYDEEEGKFITSASAILWIEGILRVSGALMAMAQAAGAGAGVGAGAGKRVSDIQRFAPESAAHDDNTKDIILAWRASLRLAERIHARLFEALENEDRTDDSWWSTSSQSRQQSESRQQAASIGPALAGMLMRNLGEAGLIRVATRVWDAERSIRPHPGALEAESVVYCIG